jgi:hypothetical protein
VLGASAGTSLEIGQPAPEFTATASRGGSISLNQYRGKTVVLEWTNADCPFTQKHYVSGNMQDMQALAKKNDVVWLSVISSAPGKHGYVNGPAADIARAEPYLKEAMLAVAQGSTVTHPVTTPYGCAVKY